MSICLPEVRLNLVCEAITSHLAWSQAGKAADKLSWYGYGCGWSSVVVEASQHHF